MSAHRPSPSAVQTLRRRVEYFFSSTALARDEVSSFSHALLDLGPVVAIGGFLRDVYLGGVRSFRSDVDFVVSAASLQALDRFAKGMGAAGNKFGGYGIELTRWRVDFWPLERTWAASHGYVPVNTLRDLVNATFFNWDAAVYMIEDRSVHTIPGYFERIDERLLEINLEPNPNPLGNAVRALRYSYKWNAAIGPRLQTHIARQLRDCGWQSFLDTEQRSFKTSILRRLDYKAVEAAINHTIPRNGKGIQVPMRPTQSKLEL